MASKRAGQVRVNLADWSGDAQVEDGANEQRHALTSKSISYDVAKVPLWCTTSASSSSIFGR